VSTGTQTVVALDLRGYVQTWADVLAAVLTDLSGAGANCEVLPEAPAEKPGTQGCFWIRGTVSGRTPGAFAIVVPQPAVQELLKANKADSAVEGADLAIALREIFSRAAVQLTTILGMNHALEEVSSTDPPQTSAQSYWLRLNASPVFLLELQLGADLVAAWQPALASPCALRLDNAVPETSGSGEDRLEVLRHVELAVSIRFGGRRMLLKDILDLCAGSVVQLDQQVQEPVDLLLDGRLIARGEVVVVDGNYGLRITEVPVHAGH
jgi:flagellar motor switch protein FliN